MSHQLNRLANQVVNVLGAQDANRLSNDEARLLESAIAILAQDVPPSRFKIIKSSELKIGDRVRLNPNDSSEAEAYMDATVINISGGYAKLYRPYVHTSDFITSGGLIPYVGISTFEVSTENPSTFILLGRRS